MVFMFILRRVVLSNAEYVNAQWYPLQFQFGNNADHNKGIVLQLLIVELLNTLLRMRVLCTFCRCDN